MTSEAAVVGSAISQGPYRFRLTRQWGPESEFTGSTLLPFCMLNPSTADASVDDPTIRRCMGFARREGMNGITVVNLMAYRTSNPFSLPPDELAGGPGNFEHIGEVAETAGYLVAAWGSHPRAAPWASALLFAMRAEGIPVLCLGRTKAGAPRHPLYVRGDQPLIPYASGGEL